MDKIDKVDKMDKRHIYATPKLAPCGVSLQKLIKDNDKMSRRNKMYNLIGKNITIFFVCVCVSCSSNVKDIDSNYQYVDSVDNIDSVFCQAEAPVTNHIKLEGTKWIYKLDEGYFDYILFKKNNLCEFYSCELNETELGIYSLNENTIVIFLSDKEIGGDNYRGIHVGVMQIKNDSIYYKESFFFIGDIKWEKNEIDNYIFTRAKNTLKPKNNH